MVHMFIALDDTVTINTDVPIAYLLEGIGGQEGSDEEFPVTKLVFTGNVEPVFVGMTPAEVIAKLEPAMWQVLVQPPLPLSEESDEDYLNRITEASK